MKKIISIILAFVILMSMSTVSLAANTWCLCGVTCPECGGCGNPDCPDGVFCGHYPAVDYTSGTQITLVGSLTQASYTVTVPAQMQPGESGTVSVTGAWSSNQALRVTTPNSVTLSYGSQTMNVGINFAGINQIGNDIAESSATAQLSVADASVLFGTWVGILEYDVELVSAESPILEGDGQTFHRMAPSALSFRSTAPMDEFQEVKINGETVDSSNYTLTEGSTIVTLSIDYLQTLDLNSYEISVVSDSGTPSGEFSVITSEQSEHGPYYNQPYYASGEIGEGMNTMEINHCFVLHEDGTASYVDLYSKSVHATSVVYENDAYTIKLNGASFTGTFSPDGTTFIVTEVHIPGGGWAPDFTGDCMDFVLNKNVAVSDDEYYYLYDNDGSYHIKPIDNTKSSYTITKSNILNTPVNGIAESAFSGNTNITSLTITSTSIKKIDAYALSSCSNLNTINFNGSIADWNNIELGVYWNNGCKEITVNCTDGVVTIPANK